MQQESAFSYALIFTLSENSCLLAVVLRMFCYRKTIGHRTRPNRTPNATRSDTKRNPIRFRTRTDAYCITIHSLKSFFRLCLLNLILAEHQLTIDYGIDRKHYANAGKNAQKHNKYTQQIGHGVEHAE